MNHTPLFRAGGMVVVSLALLTGCASIVSKSQYPVSIGSTPSGATVTVRNAAGVAIHSGVTPTTVNLRSGDGFFRGNNYVVEFEQEGYAPAITEISCGLDGWYFGNIIFGGLIGMLIVDPATGAMWRLPPNVHGELIPAQVEGDTVEPGLQIMRLDDVPAELREELVLIQ